MSIELDRTVPPEYEGSFKAARAAEAEGAENGISAWKDLLEKLPGHPEVLEALERLFEQTGKWHSLVDLLKKQAGQINTLMVLARIYGERLNQDVMVVNTYQSILKIKPDYLPAIDAAIEKYEAMSRWPDMVKMLKAKGDVVGSSEEKVEIYLRVAQLFLQRFSNQAEAIKAFEQVLESDPSHMQAIDFLSEMYEKRRDWEKLIDVMKRKAEMLPPGGERAEEMIRIAEMATDKIKRPNLCIELWEAVLEQDPANERALKTVADLYERSKEWEKLTEVLLRQVEASADLNERAAILQKLGLVYGEKLGNDDKAVETWRSLLEIQPDDRRAQEQLKKRYIAMQSWDLLEEFYSSTEKWDEFIRVLEREAERTDIEKENKISLQFKIAELWRDRKSRMDRAARCYESILELDSDNLMAAEALIPILEDSKSSAKLVEVLEIKLRHEQSDSERLSLRQRIARIAEDEIGDPARAFESYLSVFGQLPDDPVAHDDLERCAEKAGAWDKVVEVYGETIGQLKGTAALELKLRLARVLDEKVGKPEEALKHYGEILSDEPKNPQAISSLEKIYAHMGRYEELLDIYNRRLEMAEGDDERKEILFNQALLWETEVGDVGKAIQVYKSVLDMAGDEMRALAALDRIYAAEERWKDLVDIIQRELEQGVLEKDAEIDLRYRLGQISGQNLGNKAKALECYREILAIEPDHVGAWAGLEGLFDSDDHQAEAARIMSPLYEERQEWEKLLVASEILVKKSDDDFEKYELLMKSGEIASQQLGSPERAFAAYSRAFKLNPSEPRVLELLDEITTILDSWKDLVEILEEGARKTGDNEVAKNLWLKAARIYDSQIEDLEKSIKAYHSALKVDTRNEEAISALEVMYSRLERWPELIETLRSKVEITSDATEKENNCRKMAMIYEEMLDKPEDAIGCYKEILDFDPGNAPALQSLDSLFVRLEQWTELADNLQQQLGLGGSEETIIQLKLRLAELRELRLNEVDAAIESYREVLGVDAENETAIEALERIIEKSKSRKEVAEILEPIYQAMSKWEKLVQVYEVMIQEESAVARKIELLQQIAVLYETQGNDPEKAFQSLGRALTEDPSDEQTQSELERLGNTLALFEALTSLYVSVVESIEDPDSVAKYNMKIAQLYEMKLHDVDNAIKHYKNVLQIEAGNIDAVNALERSYQINENYVELAKIYLTKAEIVTSVQEQKEVLFKASQVYEEILEKLDDAVAVYLKILDIDGDDLEAIGHLETLYLRMEKWEELQKVYNRKVDLVATPEGKKEILYVLGAMYESEVKDVKRAIETYQRIIEFDPDDLQALQRLDMLFSETEEWHDLLSILEREVELAEDPDEKTALKFRIGDLYVRYLNNVGRAVECFREILSTSPEHQPSIRALEELLDSDNEPMLVADVLEPLYTQFGEWRKLIKLIEAKLKHTEDGWQRVELIHQMASLLESDLHLDAPGEAFDAYARALRDDNTNEKTLSRLEDLAGQTGRWEDLARLLDEQLENAVEADKAVLLGLKSAEIYEEKLNRIDDATSRYQKVVEFDDENREAILHLGRVFQIAERWNDLSLILQKEALIAEDPQQSLEIQFKLGQLYQLNLNDPKRAVTAYRDILAAEPNHDSSVVSLELLFTEGLERQEVAEILEPLYRMKSEWPKLVALHEAQLDDMDSAADRVSMMHQIAELYEEKISDLTEAFNWYCRAFSTDTMDERSGEEVERLAGAASVWGDLADLYQELSLKQEDENSKRICYKRLARVAEYELSDIARAVMALKGSLQIKKDDLEVLSNLDRIYTQYMQWDELVEVLEMMATVTLKNDDKVGFIFRIGSIYETQLSEIEKARQCFHRVVDDLDPSHWESLEHLENIYADDEKWRELFDVYAKMKSAADSDAVRADLLAKMGVLSSECLDDVKGAIEFWKEVLDVRGEDPAALDSLAELYSRIEKWSDLVDVLERAVVVAKDDDTRVRLYSQLGLVWGECLSRDRNALENWQNVLGIDSENLPALKAIAGIHEANQDWDPLIETTERIIDVGATRLEADELKSYYAKLGRILSEIKSLPMDSIEAWKKAYDLDPSDIAPLMSLEGLYNEQSMWEELVDTIGKKADLLEGEKQIQTLLDQAKVLEERLEEPIRAQEPYAKILNVSPLHEYAFSRIVEIKKEEQAWKELTEIYFRRINYVFESEDKVRLLHENAAIFENKLSQPNEAFSVMRKAFEEDYTNEETAANLERLATVTNKWEELLESLNQVLQTVENQTVQISLCLRVGQWYAEKLEHPDYAIAYYQQVLQLEKNNVKALVLMGRLYRSTKQWDDFVEVLKRAVDSEKDPEKLKDLLVELGEVYEDYLKDIPAAREAYKKALDIDPTLERGINALERLYGMAQNWRELIPVLRRKIETLTDANAIVETHLRIGEIFEVNLDDSHSAIEEYRKGIEIKQGHLPSLKGLERLYSKGERWPDLLDILEMQYEYATSERERISLLIRLAGMLEEEFVKPAKAAEKYEKILEIDPSHESALQSLERIYRQSGRWQDMIAILGRHIDAVHEKSSRIDLYRQMGQIFAQNINDVEQAIDSYQEILKLNPEHEEALDELAQLQNRKGDWTESHDTLKQLANIVSDPERKVDLLYRLGKINEEHLKNRQSAVEHLRSALDVNPGHLPSLASLRAIYLDDREWVLAARILETEQEHTENNRAKSKLQYELGKLYADKLFNQEIAVECFEKALNSDPDNQQAAEPLVEVYIANQRWREAEPLIDMLVRLGGKRPPDQMQPLHRKMGFVAEKLNNLDKALRAYQNAYDLDNNHLPTLLGLADIHFRRSEWEKAFKYYQVVLVHHREEQGKEDIVEIFYRLGHIKAELKERKKALNMFDKALEIDPSHRKTVEEVIALHEEQKNYEQVIHYKKMLLDSCNDEDKFAILTEIGDIWQNKLKNPQKAISSYVEASEIKPDDRVVLHKLMPLYQATKQWQKVAEVINKVTEMEEDPDRLGRLFYSIGVIYRDEIKSAEDAVEYFNKSLDSSLENLKAFEAIDRILTQKKDWKNLERNYRRMLHRIAGKDKKDIEINLWHFLGEIYRTRMGQYEAASEAFNMAAQLDPDNAVRHEILAELYVAMDQLDKAVAEHQWLIQKNPYRIESYKQLRKLYFDNKKYDKAWCLCSTLAFLKKADREEQQFFEQYRTRGMVRAQSRLDNETWIKNLFHQDESVYIGKILEVVTRAIRMIKVQPIKAFGLQKKQKRPVNDTVTFTKTFFYAAQVLNLPVVPEIYIQEDKPGGLNFAITEPMASACGASLLSGYSPQDLLFIVSKHLSYYRPEHYIRWVLPTHAELKMLILAAVKIGAPDFNLPEDKTGVLKQYTDVLVQRLTPMEQENLGKIVRRFVKSGEVADIKKWMNALELTGCRAGFLLANDLEVAARMIQVETGTVDEIAPKEKIKELVLFSVSEQYFKLRESLGIMIGT